MMIEARGQGSGIRGHGFRFLLAHLLQVPSFSVILFVFPGWAWVAASVFASLVTAVSTDSGWRWRNRLLVIETIVWLTLAICSIP